MTDYNDLSHEANEAVLIIENTESLYLEVVEIAKRINLRPEGLRPPQPKDYRTRLDSLISAAKREYYRITGDRLKLTAKDRKDVSTFLLELAQQYAEDMKRNPESW